MNNLPDEAELKQNRMNFSVTNMPSLITINNAPTSNNKATMNKIKNFVSKFSSMVIRQVASTINKLAIQGSFFFDIIPKLLPINEPVTSLNKVISESSGLI